MPELVPRALRRGPALVVFLLFAAFLALALASLGFRGVRSLWAPLPYRNPGELITLTQRDIIGQTTGVPMRAFRYWREKTQTLQGMAGYIVSGRLAHVTPDFFTLLGSAVRIGRDFRSGDEFAEPPPAVVSDAFWRSRLGADPKAVGSIFDVDGRRRVLVVGVLPKDFWAVTPRVDMWLPLDPESRYIFTIGAVARLKHGTSSESARKELAGLTPDARVRVLGPFVAPLGRHDRTLLAYYALCLPAALLFGALLVARATSALRNRTTLRPNWRYWPYFLLKVALLLATVASFWIEASRRLQSSFMADIVFTWLFFVCAAIAVWWSYRDQMRRCPVCLNRLTLPARIGSWSSALLDPVETELLCENGHSTLLVPETQSSASEPEHWTALDESWRDLFTPGKNK
jgi:hypothetical protein